MIVTQQENFIAQETVELYTYLTQGLEVGVQSMLVNAILNVEEGTTIDIPKNHPPEASVLARVLHAIKTKKGLEQKLFKELTKDIPIPFTKLFWEEAITQESRLREVLAEKLKPWVLKNYSIENV